MKAKPVGDLKIEYVRVDELKPAEYNPRKISAEDMEKLKESIERFGMIDPAIVNKAPERKNIVIGGHQRLKAAVALGHALMPVVYVNIPDPEREKELNLRLNRNQGEFDEKLLAAFDDSLLKLVGFTKDELDAIYGLSLTEDFNVADEQKKLLKGEEMRTKVGQLWELGDHRLRVGDATDVACWKDVLGDERFDFMFTDPPYRLAYSKQRVRKVKTKDGFKLKRERVYDAVGDTEKSGKFKFGAKGNRSYEGIEMKRGVPEFDEWLTHANAYQHPERANVMIFENWKNTPDLWHAVEKYWKIMNLVIWHTPNRMQGFTRADVFYNKYDMAIYAEKGDVKENELPEEELEQYIHDKGLKLLETFDIALYGHAGKKSDTEGKGKKAKWGKVSDHVTWSVDTGGSGQNIVFGTKPVQILAPYMKALSPREGVVMEPFGGSGSTIICGEIMKRKVRAIELGPLNAEVILRRWEKFTGKKAKLIHE